MEDVGSRRPMPPTARITWEGRGVGEGVEVLDYSLIPTPHRVLIIHRSRREVKNGKGLGLLTQVDMRGKQDERREPQILNSALDHEVKCSIAGQNFRHFAWLNLKLLEKQTCFQADLGPSPLYPLT